MKFKITFYGYNFHVEDENNIVGMLGYSKACKSSFQYDRLVEQAHAAAMKMARQLDECSSYSVEVM